ncbi:succinylglutamate desuccinylase/aspartoacylase family protein [Geopsychrobacter electrodiphilus]|uniref:succinylglutamate desuccinylase/aspartoacylase family protein n=1 Tax=Geopsychrobacter electrodiphilus TaxID=225196 RepID=UPI00036776E5|nr:succinylglutamate desuccinylase/aspartoacylase family protein [Geopsychrobacter electrodiphilus]
MRNQAAFSLGGVNVSAGTRTTIDLPMAKLYTHAEVTLPVHVIHGRQKGPTLFVSAAIHGDEINGVEIIRKLLQSRSLSRLKGTLLAIPVVNPFGFIQRTRYLPDRRDLNRSFPGSATGSLASRLAHLFMDQIVNRCSHGIDLHTGSNYRSNLPQIRADLSDPETARLADAFGAPLVIHSEVRDGSLREAVADKGIPILLYEAGEALYFNPAAIKTGTQGILNVMRAIGMLSPARKKPAQDPIHSDKTHWIRATMSGIFEKRVSLGSLVHKGDLLGIQSDPLGDETQKLFSPLTGVVIGQLNLPLTYEGDALMNIARVKDTDEAEETLDDYTSGLTEADYGAER